MKLKSLLYIPAVCAGLILASCDVTDLTPRDSFTDESYWANVSDLELYANGLYNYTFTSPSTLVYGDRYSDNFVTDTYSTRLFNTETVPQSASSSNGWYWNYIRNCNYFMTHYDTVEGEEADINQYVAEVRFIRARLYFDKVKMFGDVPWYDKDLQTTDTDELYKARDPRSYVVLKIIEDLEWAIEWLPESGSEVQGRINADAARTELARVCLYFGTLIKYYNDTESGDYNSTSLLQKAVSVTNTIINSGKYDIVKGTDAGCGQNAFEGYPLYYTNQFTQNSLAGNAECIMGQYFSESLYHNAGRLSGVNRDNGFGLSKDFIESFLMADGTPIYNDGSGYLGDDNIEDEIAGRDPRLYQIFDNDHRPYYVSNGERQLGTPSARVATTIGVTGYPSMKFHPANSEQQEASHSSYDWFIYRYAEVLLINAEANAELKSCTQDVLDKTINLLRDRVGMAHLTVSPAIDANPTIYYSNNPDWAADNALLYEIRRERRIELINEDKRMDDIVRWKAGGVFANPKTMFGMNLTYAADFENPEGVSSTLTDASGNSYDNPDYNDRLYPYGALTKEAPQVEWNGKIYQYQYVAGFTVEEAIAIRPWTDNDRRWLYPIPLDELTLNPNLTQNPGW